MKKAITLLVAAVSAVLASFSLAAPPLAQDQESRAAAIANLMQGWQARILAFNLPVDDAKNWSSRNMAKFGKLNADRLALAQRASTLGELEMVLLEAPIAEGSRLDVLMANKRGDISMMSSSGAAKLSPGTSPASYAGLVFSALSPCRILDSRPSQGGTGSWLALSTNLIKIGPYSTAGGGYATGPGAQGGSATSCGLDALAGPGQVAMIMAAVSTVSQAGAGYLTFFSLGAPNPGTSSVSQWFQPGYVQTSFVLIPSDLNGAVAASGFTSAGTEVIIDVVGYFAAETNDGVTSITAGTGLTGGTITTTGTVAIATAYQLPQACTNGQVAQSNGAGSWSCVTPIVSGGTVTGVSASAPLASSGGTAPNISLTGSIPVASGGTGQTTLASNGIVYGQGTAAVGTAVGTTGQVLAGTAGAPTWSDSLSLNGNIALVNPSTAIAGNILKAGLPFLHNYGVANTFVGQNAGNFTMTGSFNTVSGQGALSSNTTGSSNTASGYQALLGNTTGNANTASGVNALASNTTGVSNTASGYFSLYGNTTGNTNSAFGVASLQNNTTGSQNTAGGYYALISNTTGFNNTANGYQALAFNTTGNSNTANGYQALLSNTTGNANTASGLLALNGNTTGVSNTASGASALYGNTTGSSNTASGVASLQNNTIGAQNTAIGLNALMSNTSGNNNSASGMASLQNNTTGVSNTASGYQALFGNTTGGTNIALGFQAGFNLTTGSFNIDIGNQGVAGESSTTRIGSSQTRAFIAGIRGISTGVSDAITVMIDSGGQLGTISSSRRFKDDIADMSDSSSALMKLRPVTFRYKSDQESRGRRLQYGLIAEEVAEVYPGLVARSADGQVETVMYQFLPSMLLNEVQKQQRTIETQTTHIADLERERRTHTAEIAGLKSAMAEIAELKQQMAHLARLLDQQRAGTVTAGLGLK